MPNPLRFLSWPFLRVERLPVRTQTIIHLTLYGLTFASTFWVGSVDGLNGALNYSLALMAIITAHEAGHFFMARRYGVQTSLPFFLPMPLPPFGTMGAVMRLRSPIPNRRALMAIGAGGPLAGMVVALPLMALGLHLSKVTLMPAGGDEFIGLGESLLFSSLTRLLKGTLPPGHDVVLHPVAYAAWVGGLLTALNLLPVGQLDGGHVTYALFRRRSRLIGQLFHGAVIILLLFVSVIWMLPALLLSFFRDHPPTLNDRQPLGRIHTVVGWIALLLLILCFMPMPFQLGRGLIPMIMGVLK